MVVSLVGNSVGQPVWTLSLVGAGTSRQTSRDSERFSAAGGGVDSAARAWRSRRRSSAAAKRAARWWVRSSGDRGVRWEEGRMGGVSVETPTAAFAVRPERCLAGWGEWCLYPVNYPVRVRDD